MDNLKKILNQPSKLSPGHRSCQGCAAPLIARHVLREINQPVVVASATGCLEVTTSLYPQTAWRVPWIHSAFENAAATISGVESAYRALKKKGKIRKEIKFVVFGGDGGTFDIGLQSLSGALERRHNFLYICYSNEAYMNCLSISSLIMTKTGLKKITEIKKGDKIYAFNQKNNQLILKKCAGVFDNGIKKVYDLQTLHHNIKATDNHPFLILKKSGNHGEKSFVWKKLSAIKIGDEVVALKNIDSGKRFKFRKFKKTKIGDYKVTHINEVKLPEYSSPDLMKYLGIYVGDGWTRNKRGEVGFALPAGYKERKILIELQSKIFGGRIKKDNNYVYINSVNLAKFIDSLGFNHGAKNKTIPDWVFTLSVEEKKSFIQGLILSDGYQINNSFRYVSASNDLLKRLRLLLQTINYRVGKIHIQKKKKGTYVVYRKLLKDSEYGYICFSEKKKHIKIDKYRSQYRAWNFLIENKYFDIEKVKKVKLVGREPTLDLRVEGEHNFIANGIVVHNTGIQRSSATPLGAATTTTPVGKVKQGKELLRKDLTKIIVAHNIEYVAQASIGYWQDLANKVRKALAVKGPAFINVLSPCPLGWKFSSALTTKIADLAVDTCFWPLYEIEDGVYKITHQPLKKLPITDFLKPQGRFRHLFKPRNKKLLQRIQKEIDRRWLELLALAKK